MIKGTKKNKAVGIAAGAPLVGILTGSPNDLPTVVKVRDTLTELGIPSEIVVASAHRTPDKVLAYLERAHRRGCRCSSAAPVSPPTWPASSPATRGCR
jgi:5-(carboxyamino)imidazole ribonucleotide mutase